MALQPSAIGSAADAKERSSIQKLTPADEFAGFNRSLSGSGGDFVQSQQTRASFDSVGLGFQPFGCAQAHLPNGWIAGPLGKFPVPCCQFPQFGWIGHAPWSPYIFNYFKMAPKSLIIDPGKLPFATKYGGR
jgi:hypothetical protein